MHRNEVLELSLTFALNVIAFSETLDLMKKYVISKQLLRSGTSIGACIREAQKAESRADFFHKMSIAAKEAEETEYWLILCNLSNTYPKPEVLLNEIKSIQKLLSKILSRNTPNNQKTKV